MADLWVSQRHGSHDQPPRSCPIAGFWRALCTVGCRSILVTMCVTMVTLNRLLIALKNCHLDQDFRCINTGQTQCCRRLARPRTSPFHGGNAGSNPAGDANILKKL
jgi:hypothetical protein